MSNLVSVSKDGVALDVHTVTLDAHMRDGWMVVPTVSPSEPVIDPLDHDGDGRKGGSLPKLAVGKGPGGRFYVKRGKEIISGPYATEEEGSEAMAREQSA